MKKLIIFCSAALLTSFITWNCSTKLDILDNYKETTIVYGLLDQTQDTQYIRVEKAFLGPDNALTMAQNYDSINFLNSLQVTIEGLHNGQVVQTFSTSNGLVFPRSFAKDGGIFAGPNQVVYGFSTPPGTLNSSYEYKLTVTNVSTNNTVTATTNLVETTTSNVFNIVTPSTSISFEPTTNNSTFDYKWNAAPTARIYQPTLRFYYTEYYVNGDSAQLATDEWNLQALTTTDVTANSQQDVKTDKLSFYNFVAQQIAVSSNVVKRRARFVECVVYAGNDELKNYMEINGASNSLAQEHPLYTNINGGYGVFAARSRATRSNINLSVNSIDGNNINGFKGLTNGSATCQLSFVKTDNVTVPGCQ